jgi:hypothetical protein
MGGVLCGLDSNRYLMIAVVISATLGGDDIREDTATSTALAVQLTTAISFAANTGGCASRKERHHYQSKNHCLNPSCRRGRKSGRHPTSVKFFVWGPVIESPVCYSQVL